MPLEVTRGAALAWVAAVGGKVAAASRDRLVAVKLGRERDGGDVREVGAVRRARTRVIWSASSRVGVMTRQ